MTRAAPVTQADIRRAVLALKAVGEVVSGVEIRPDRSVVILTGAGKAAAISPGKSGSDWDDLEAA